MGLDTVIHFKAKPDFKPEDLMHNLPHGFAIQSIQAFQQGDCPDATHDIDNNARYYGDGYERGPWPLISATLMILLATPTVEKVWYGSDCRGVEEMNPDYLATLGRHYMRHGTRPYFDQFYKVTQ